MNKYDKDLTPTAIAVRDYLISQRVETPMLANRFTSNDKKLIIEENFENIMRTLGLDLSDDSLEKSPFRFAKMYVDEIFWGLDYSKFPKITTVDNKMRYDEMVLVDKINVQSNCEHHFVNIDGECRVAYIPKEKVLGLSKINRVVEFFSKRPQIQERLTEQIFFALSLILQTEDVAVKIKANHFCVKSRGIQDVNSVTTTSKLGGTFKADEAARHEFLTL